MVDSLAKSSLVLKEWLSNGASHNKWFKSILHATENLLPDKILSVGDCIARFAPLFEWAGASATDFQDFGINQDQVAALADWANERLDKTVGYPNTFFTLSTAREYIQRFISDSDNLQLLGIGVHQTDLYLIDTIKRLNPSREDASGVQIAGFAGSGFAQAITKTELPENGELLGYDLIACRYQIDHGWHCNGLALDGLNRFGFKPNSFGLINLKQNADKLADFANQKLIEDSIWLPVLVIRHALQHSV